MGEEDGTSYDRETLIPTFDEEAMGLMAAFKGGAGGGSSIAERRAAKFGFNAVKISTPRFRTNSPSASPAARSPCCITLPAGISPSALLDSPIMLPNAQALPSPTTGTFPLPSFSHESSVLNSATCEDGDKGNAIDSFIFKPYGDDKSPPCCSSPGDKSQQTDVVDQAMVLEKSSAGFEFPTEFAGEATTKYCLDSSNGVKFFNDLSMEDKSVDMKMPPGMARVQASLSREPIHGDDSGTHDLSEGNQNESNQSIGTGKTSEDGYNWRKYGQKQVKGSEYPRSYYKCTHPNCHVKKKVERSHDGQITEIIYKGGHNHSKPQPNRRAALGSGLSSDEMSEVSEGSGTCLKIEDRSVWTNVQSGSASNKLGSDGMEITSSASVLSELSDPLSATHGKPIAMIESTEIPEPSSTVVSHEDDEDGAILGTVLLEGDADDEEPESKRRKQESGVMEASLAPRAVREPRVVVQIESDVDILDDGYRWRKYGQKVVKGNPNPRSYYKCTSAGCSVRKHVERASHNLKCVITTYEGKHNHEVPVARNSSHMNSSGANGPPVAANNAQSPLTFSRNTSILKPETEIQDLAPPFDRKPEFSNEYLRPSFHGNFSNDVRFGASSLYPMKFPPLHSSIPYASFGLNPNRMAIQQASPVASVVPDFPMSLPLALPPSGNLSLVGFDFNSGKSVAPVQPMLSGQHLQQNDMRFLRPKQEQKDDILYNASMPLADHTDASSLSSYPSSPVYSQIMGSFPS